MIAQLVVAGISRLAAEQHLRSAGQYYGVDYVILRMHSVYGPHMDLAPSRSTIVARAIQAVRFSSATASASVGSALCAYAPVIPS